MSNTLRENNDNFWKALKVKLEPKDFLWNIEFKEDLIFDETRSFVTKDTNKNLFKDITLNKYFESFIIWDYITIEEIKYKGLNYFLDGIMNAVNEWKATITSWECYNYDIASIPFFKVTWYTISWPDIILYTTDNISFIWNLKDYIDNWLKSIDFYERDLEKSENENNLWDLNIKINNWQAIVSNSTQEINNIVCDSFDVLDNKEKTILIIYDNKLEKLKISDDWKSDETIWDIVDLSHLWNIKQLKIDKNKNFISLIVEKDQEYILKILSVDWKNFYEEVKDIKEVLYIDEVKNDIYCIDTDGILRYINTNFNSFERDYSGKIWKQAELAKEKAIKILEWWIRIWSNKEANENIDLINQIYETEIDFDWAKLVLRDIIDNAKTSDDFDKINLIISNLKSFEAFAKIPWLFSSIEIDIKTKSDKVKLANIYAKISKIEVELEKDDTDFVMYFLYKKDLEDILKARWTIDIATNDEDKKVWILMKKISDIIESLKETASDDIMTPINENMEVLKSSLENIMFSEHISSIYNSDEYKKILELSEFLTSDKKIEVKRNLNKLIQDKINSLETDKLETEKKHQIENEEKIKSIRKDFLEIQKLIDIESDEISILKIKSENGLVLNIIDRIFDLSIADSEKLHSELENIFSKKISSIRFWKSAFKTHWSLVDFWDGVKVSKFIPEVDKQVHWSIKWKRNNWEIIIYFENNLWWKIEPEIEKMYRLEKPLAVDKKDFAILQDYVKKWNSKYKKEFYNKLYEFKNAEKDYIEEINKDEEDKDKFEEVKNKYETLEKEFEEIKSKSYLARMFYKLPRNKVNPRPYVPEIQPNTVIWPTTKKFLREFSALADVQIKSRWAWSWIIIIESDAWTWKNFKMDLYAHFTNREVFEMQWNQTAQKEDILYSYELWPDWTYRLPSHLIKWITTPWSIIVFDEINTYPPEVLKLLNPLFDGRRYINDSQMWKIELASDVVIVWLMNPSNYLWTSKLSQEAKSRSRFMIDEYPAEFDENDNPSSEEAYLISRHFEWSIWDIDEDAFEWIWQKVIVENKSYDDREIKNIFLDLKKYISLVNDLRKQYKDTQTGTATEEFNFIVSLREWIQVVEEYDINWWNMKQAISDVIRPKIEEQEEKELFDEKLDIHF